MNKIQNKNIELPKSTKRRFNVDDANELNTPVLGNTLLSNTPVLGNTLLSNTPVLGNTIEHECPMYKVQKLNEFEFQPAITQVRGGYDNFNDIDFTVESFLGNQSTRITIPAVAHVPAPDPALVQVPKVPNTTLAKLIHICYEPIKTKSDGDDKMVEKEILELSNALKDALKDTSKLHPQAYMKETCEKSEVILMEKLKILYNAQVFKTYDFSKDGFNPKFETVLYEQLYKVNVHIRKTETMEFIIYFDFPFYLSIRINIMGKIFIVRHDLYKKIEKLKGIDKIHYNSSNTNFNILDIVTASKFIGLITSKYFTTGFDLVSKLMHIMDVYKINSNKLPFNKFKINFEKFAKLYKNAINIVSEIPLTLTPN